MITSFYVHFQNLQRSLRVISLELLTKKKELILHILHAYMYIYAILNDKKKASVINGTGPNQGMQRIFSYRFSWTTNVHTYLLKNNNKKGLKSMSKD